MNGRRTDSQGADGRGTDRRTVDGRMNGRLKDGRLTDERGGRLTDKLSECSNRQTSRRIEETDGLTKNTGGLTDADNQADG